MAQLAGNGLRKHAEAEADVKRCEEINCYKSLPKHKTVIEDPDNIIQDFKTMRLGFTV